MATTLRNDAKQEIINILREEGYATYALLVELFDIYLTDDPEVVGYMIPGKAKIVINGGLSISQVSLIVRHEILHEFLTHHERRGAFEKDNTTLGSDHELANIAGDYEISNRGYTDKDKANARAIVLGDKVLRGLVTEDEYPDWENATFEEMYRDLLEKRKKDQDALKKLLQQLQSISKKDLDDLMDEMDQMGGGPSMDGIPSDDQDGKGKPMPGKGKPGEEKDDSSTDPTGSGGPLDKETQDKLNKLKDAAGQAQKKADELDDSSDKDGSVFDSDADVKAKNDLAKRVAEIKRIFEDLKAKQAILNNTDEVIEKERQIKAARNIERYNKNPLTQFKLSLNSFIYDQLSHEEEETYARENQSYADTEFIMPGHMEKENYNIPLINVYWDVSGSFPEGSPKSKMAEQAIATLNKYKQSGEIEIVSWYFADRVASTRAGAGGGTRGTPILEHVKQTKPTNVIVITDGDISDCHEVVKVPGAVWYLFFESSSENIASHLLGKKQTRSYFIK